VEIEVSADINFDWTHKNLDRGIRHGYDAAEKAWRDYMIERHAKDAVIAAEQALGRHPHEVSNEGKGYDIESRDTGTEPALRLGVKGHMVGAHAITLAPHEVLAGYKYGDNYVLSVVPIDTGGHARAPVYVRNPFGRDLEVGSNGLVLFLPELLSRGAQPS
jgi:hypothetical protein